MLKTNLTKQAERLIYRYTSKMGVYGCFEVTIGFNGEYRGGIERVDYMTCDTQGIFRCYEIKVSVSDFKSKAKLSFLGDYNYYVMPKELYLEVEKNIPWGVGVILSDGYPECIRKPKKQQVSIGMKATLMESMVRSLFREQDKLYKIKGYWEAEQ